ncbi:tetratricopeptide repeat protein [Ramlibacter sp. AW1]|uniref:Tetratricopeptide repeat protein n=1 Tax=Ramlibacter aurantiacus TaxID=2801330 RepID=A0A937D1Q1_9BURK|nr:tetratricopeptide repeat protein [Ramlibacter aurantiacus]MBL0419000.1 tetratricopeptide repeat protein [Ramlibacter aurantiacus]
MSRTSSIRRPAAAVLAALVISCGVPLQAQEADQLLQQAREAARQDRNRASADLFEQLLRQAPHRRPELLPEYADQLTYSERARQAVPLYREALATGAVDAPQRQRLLKGLGLALLWSDQPGEAGGVYRELLREQPGDLDAQRNLARALSWSGRQREAIAVLEPLLQQRPDDREARVQLAESQQWMGRPDLARRTLADSRLEGDEKAARLRDEGIRSTRPRTWVDAQRSSQSDELDIRQWRLGHEASLADGRGAAGLRLTQLDFERGDGTDDVRLTRPSVFGRWRFSDAAELNAELGAERIDPRGTPSFDRWIYASWFTWWPGDQVRIDFSSSRTTFDNLRSLRQGLTAVQNGASVDFTPSERQRYNLRLERGIYSDGNRRWAGQASGEWRMRLKPEVWLGVRHGRQDFEQQLDNGYFNPDRVRVTQATARLQHRLPAEAGPWDVTAFLALGREDAVPDGSKPAWDASLAIGRQLTRDTRLEARVQRFSSRTQSAGGTSGFERTTVGLRLEQRW